MEASERIATVNAIHQEARQQGLYFLHTEDEELRGPSLRVNGKTSLAFASCSYLGLEHHPELVDGVVQAVTRFGTQFSATRGFVSAPPYAEVEDLMSELLGGYALVCSSTSLAHQSALGVLATEQDAIVIDHQAHYSIHQATQLARANGCHVELVRHGELERALDAIQRLAAVHRTVWFVVDDVYSMYGDREKLRLGSVVQRNCVYLQARDHFHSALLREIAAEASLRRPQVPGPRPHQARATDRLYRVPAGQEQ